MPSPRPSPLGSALVATFDALPDQLSRTIRDRIDPAWIEQALRQGEGISVRRRKMPADVVVWVMLGACLFAAMSFAEMLKSFGLVPLTRPGNPQPLPTSGAINAGALRFEGEPVRGVVVVEQVLGVMLRG
jgi:hypothetical protein